MIRLPSHAVEMIGKLRHWRPEFQGTHGRLPTLEECAEYCKTTPHRLKEYLDRSDDAISLDGFVRAADDEITLMDSVSDGYDLFDDVQWGIDVEQVGALMRNLNDKEKYIVSGAFALEGGAENVPGNGKSSVSHGNGLVIFTTALLDICA